MTSADEPRHLTKVVLRGASLASAGHMLTQILNLVTYLVLARLLTPHEIGEFAAGSIVLAPGLLVSESGMLAAIIQRRDRVDEAASTAFVATFLGGICLALLALALAPVVGLYFSSHKIEMIAAAMSGYIALQQPIIVPDALMQRRFSFVRRVVLDPLGGIAFGATAVACTAAAGLGVWGLVLGMYAGVVVRVTLSWTLVGWRPQRRLVSFAMWRELARFGRHVIAAEGVSVGYSQAQTALVGRFVGTGALGQFGYALRIATQPAAVLINGLSYVLLPALARISHDEDRLRAAVLRALRLVAAVAFPTSLILLALGEPLSVLVFGDRWRPAGRAVAYMCAFSAGWGIVSLATETWKAVAQPQWLPKTQLCGAVIGTTLLVAALPFGLSAVAASLSVTAVATACYALRGVAKVLHVRARELGRVLLPPLLASAVMAAVVAIVERAVRADRRAPATGLPLIACELVLATVVYVGSLAVISPQTRDDLRRAFSTMLVRLGRQPPHSEYRLP